MEDLQQPFFNPSIRSTTLSTIGIGWPPEKHSAAGVRKGDLYRELEEAKFPNLWMFIARFIAMFGTTYLCEQFLVDLIRISPLVAAILQTRI